MNDDLLISIGADLSAFNASLNKAEQSVKETLKTISTFSNTNKIDIGINLAQFIEGKEKEWDSYRTAVTDWELQNYLDNY